MAITFRQAEGARAGGTGTRLISGIAGNVITTTLAMAGQAVGNILEIFSSSTTANNAFYTLIAFSGSTLTVRPTPTAQGTSGSVARLALAVARTVSGAAAITSILALPGGFSLIEVAGANFFTNQITENDRLVVTGNATAANNGGWYIQEILSQSLLVVRPPDGGAGMTTEAVGTGSISIRHGCHDFFVTDESPMSWQRFLDVGAAIAGPSLFQGSGLARDYVRKLPLGGDTAAGRIGFVTRGISRILIDQPGLGANSFWDSLNEVAIDARAESPGSGGSIGPVRLSAVTAFTFPLRIRLGTDNGGDRFTAEKSSVWVGYRRANASATQLPWTVVGSLWDGVAIAPLGGQMLPGPGSKIAASIIRPSMNSPAGTILESVIATSAGPFGVTTDQANTLISGSDFGTTALTTIGQIITGMLFGSAITTLPVYLNVTTGVVFLDPRVDYDFTVYVDTAIGSDTTKSYTYNPRYVAKESAASAPTPISGITIRILEINETSMIETQIFSGTTNAGGQIVAGAGIALRRQLITDGGAGDVVTLFSHRIIIEGGGFRLSNEVIQMKSKFTSDVPVERIAPSYEDEFDE